MPKAACWAVKTAYCRAGYLAAAMAVWKAVRTVATKVEQTDLPKVELKAARRAGHKAVLLADSLVAAMAALMVYC